MTRNRVVDIARGIAIIAIILGHLNLAMINYVVFTFHVPIFYLFTGYFMKQEPVALFVKKKAHTLLVPYAVTCISIVMLSGIVSAFYATDALVMMKEWTWASLYGAGDSYTEPIKIKAIGAIWFLWATFWGSIFLQLSLRWKAAVRVLWIAVLFAFGYLTARKLFWFPLSIQAGCCATLFMYVGYCVKQKIAEIKKLSKEIKIVGTLIAFLAWISFICTFKSFWLVHNDFGRGIVDVLRSLCACYCIYLISKGIDKHSESISGILAYLGRHSLIILCVHIVELDLIKWGSIIDRITASGIPYLFSCGLAFIMKMILIIGCTVAIVKVKEKTECTNHSQPTRMH